MRRFVCSILLACALGCRPAEAPPNAPASAPGEAKADSAPADVFRVDAAGLTRGLDAYVAEFGKHWGEPFELSGYVMVAQHGEPVYARGFGRANRADGAAPGPDTTFRIGSVTKQFTAVAILRLQEQGKLRVTDTVRTHMPDYPETGDRVTIHHLLTHTSGIPSYTARPDHDPAEGHSVSEMLAIFADQPLEFEPGTEFRYSNSGYFLLGAIVEAVSGRSYADYLAQEVLTPAGMRRTGYGDDPDDPDAAAGYRLTGMETTVPAPPIHMSNPFAAGALRSTPNDLVVWDAALRGDGLLTEASKTAMLTGEEQRDFGLGEATYAYGVVVGDLLGHRYIAHDGGINGFGTFFIRFPDDAIVVVAYTNRNPFPIHLVGKAAAMLAYGEDPPPPPPETPLQPVAPAVRKKLAGGYLLDDASRKTLVEAGLPEPAIDGVSVLTLTEQDGKLLLQSLVDEEATMLHSVDGRTLVTKVDHLTLAFDPEPESVDRFTVRQGPLSATFTRNDKGAARARNRAARTRRDPAGH